MKETRDGNFGSSTSMCNLKSVLQCAYIFFQPPKPGVGPGLVNSMNPFSSWPLHICLSIPPVYMYILWISSFFLYGCYGRQHWKSYYSWDNIHCSALIHQAYHLTTQGGQAWFPLHKSMLTTPNHILVLCLFGNSFQDYLRHHFLRDQNEFPRSSSLPFLKTGFILISPNPWESPLIAITFLI